MSPVRFDGVREADWPERLASYISERVGSAFVWGGHDCVGFALGAVHAMTNKHPWMPVYQSRREAVRAIKDLGGLVPAFTAVFGAPIAPAFARAGDVGLVTPHALTVCNGALWVGAGQCGLVHRPLKDVLIAWRAG